MQDSTWGKRRIGEQIGKIFFFFFLNQKLNIEEKKKESRKK